MLGKVAAGILSEHNLIQRFQEGFRVRKADSGDQVKDRGRHPPEQDRRAQRAYCNHPTTDAEEPNHQEHPPCSQSAISLSILMLIALASLASSDRPASQSCRN